MEVIPQSWQFEEERIDPYQIMRKLEAAGRTCHKTEGNVSWNSSGPFIRKLISIGHHSVLEHASISVRIITDRGVTHEIVRHRLAAYSQESTRYCNYGEGKLGIKFIAPADFELDVDDIHILFKLEEHYNKCLEKGRTPQQARYFLPNGLKTEIVMTCNMREWRHFFTMRAHPAAHPQMLDLAADMLKGFRSKFPNLFFDIPDPVIKYEDRTFLNVRRIDGKNDFEMEPEALDDIPV